MKYISSSSTEKFENGNALVHEYSFDTPKLDLALITISGRYPEQGRHYNEVSFEAAFITEGSGSVSVEGQEYKLQPGDSVLVNPGEKFHWEGHFKMVVACTPTWSPEQYKEACE